MPHRKENLYRSLRRNLAHNPQLSLSFMYGDNICQLSYPFPNFLFYLVDMFTKKTLPK